MCRTHSWRCLIECRVGSTLWVAAIRLDATTPLCPYRRPIVKMCRRRSPPSRLTHSGTVLLDTGGRLAFDADAFDRSGLRLLRLGQRLNIRVVDGQITALNLATLPLD
jgi:hypothetical protein